VLHTPENFEQVSRSGHSGSSTIRGRAAASVINAWKIISGHFVDSFPVDDLVPLNDSRRFAVYCSVWHSRSIVPPTLGAQFLDGNKVGLYFDIYFCRTQAVPQVANSSKQFPGIVSAEKGKRPQIEERAALTQRQSCVIWQPVVLCFASLHAGHTSRTTKIVEQATGHGFLPAATVNLFKPLLRTRLISHRASLWRKTVTMGSCIRSRCYCQPMEKNRQRT